MGQRVAHGMLTLSYAVGLIYQLGFMERTVLAFRGLEMKFSLPVFVGAMAFAVRALPQLFFAATRHIPRTKVAQPFGLDVEITRGTNPRRNPPLRGMQNDLRITQELVNKMLSNL